MAKKTTGKAPSTDDLKWISPDDLYLDAKNPRLAAAHLSVNDQAGILGILWREKAVDELVESIATNGYWSHEELFATKESGKLIVIEGNRRLAAVKLLIDESLRQKIGVKSIPRLTDTGRKNLETLPVIECSRRDVWQYLGFKHVNGPQDWDSIAKAEYIARIHNEYGISLDEIARTIGDQNNTVKRLYRGLMVLEQAEGAGVFNREDRWNPRFAYSHLWTGLNYTNIQSFIGLTPDKGFKPNPINRNKVHELGELCVWLYGSKEQNQPPVIRSQNPDLRKLEEVLSSPNGIAAMRAKYPLDVALNASRGDERLLRESLVKAEQSLKEAKGFLVTGYHGETDLLKSASSIQAIATSIYEDMEGWVEVPRSKSTKAKR
jgi:hypothetical protein